MTAEKKKIIVAMSGGVDSSVAAALLAKEGHEVIGVTLRLMSRGATGFGCCGSPDDILIAKRSAEAAGVPHYVLDYSADFEKSVINYFVDSYTQGETPNPCLACNRTIKFDKLKVFADTLNGTHLATGHYARIEKEENNGKTSYHLYEACDPTKDQSYVLYNLSTTTLATTLFPVGNKPKSEIREIARQIELPNADKKDSQEICFVPNRDYGAFIDQNVKDRSIEKVLTLGKGAIKDQAGNVVGEHKGVAYYTVGQRNGLNLSVNKRMYVTRIEATTNTLIVGDDKENFNAGLIANDVHWVQGTPPDNQFDALIKIRYKHEPTKATITVKEGTFEVKFHEPQRSVSPGQAAVIYRWSEKHQAREVIGGGKIIKAQ